MSCPVIIGDSLKLWPDTFLSTRLGAGWLELVFTQGTALIEGVHLQHLVRLILHGEVKQLKEDWALEDYGCGIHRVSFGQSRQLPRHPLPFPDSCPVPAGWLCVEGIHFVDYHPAASLQFVAKQRRGFLLGFALCSYQGCCSEARGILEDFGEDVQHLSAWDEGRFLKWPPCRRLQAADLETTTHQPDSWDSLEAIRDLRGEAEQAKFMERVEAHREIGIAR